ncbi:hypothetical protein LEMLEM_LOCUS22083, partial [Lemmus lemmus]
CHPPVKGRDRCPGEGVPPEGNFWVSHTSGVSNTAPDHWELLHPRSGQIFAECSPEAPRTGRWPAVKD